MNMTLNLAGILGFGLFLALVVTAVIVVVIIAVSRRSDGAGVQEVQPTPMPVQAAPTEETEIQEPAEEAPSQPHTLGEKIKSHRIRCGMTQEYVAEALDVTRQAVSKWETDSSDPSTSNLLALAKLFGISPAELLDGLE